MWSVAFAHTPHIPLFLALGHLSVKPCNIYSENQPLAGIFFYFA
jgi:hypothetical protein